MYCCVHCHLHNLMRVQSYVYADVMFLLSPTLPNALCCNTLFCHTRPPMREASRIGLS